MISDETTLRQFYFSLESQLQKFNFHQHGVIVLLHIKLEGENAKRHMHSLQILAKNLSFKGVQSVSQARKTCVCVRSCMNEVSQKSKDFSFL